MKPCTSRRIMVETGGATSAHSPTTDFVTSESASAPSAPPASCQTMATTRKRALRDAPPPDDVTVTKDEASAAQGEAAAAAPEGEPAPSPLASPPAEDKGEESHTSDSDVELKDRNDSFCAVCKILPLGAGAFLANFRILASDSVCARVARSMLAAQCFAISCDVYAPVRR